MPRKSTRGCPKPCCRWFPELTPDASPASRPPINRGWPPADDDILGRFMALAADEGSESRMILVIDVGNTRLKWAWLTSTGLSDQQAVVHRDAKPAIWTAALFDSGQTPRRVLISNVAGPVMAKTLARMTKKAFKVRAEFVTAAARVRRTGERLSRSQLLGADRWLALVGAWTKTRSALCVVDAGTAVKVDSIDASGHHLGGLIVPGIHMMREALMSKTSDIAKAAEHSTPSLGRRAGQQHRRRGIPRRGVRPGGDGRPRGRGHRTEHRREAQAVHHGGRRRHDHGHHALAR